MIEKHNNALKLSEDIIKLNVEKEEVKNPEEIELDLDNPPTQETHSVQIENNLQKNIFQNENSNQDNLLKINIDELPFL